MSEEIIENNKLIAEFMGFEMCSGDEISAHKPIINDNKIIGFTHREGLSFYSCVNNGGRRGSWDNASEMKFTTSWDWIFPVLEKIRSCGCIIEISMCFQTECRICIVGSKKEKTINIYSELSGIEGVYDCIIQFIKHYNEKMVK